MPDWFGPLVKLGASLTQVTVTETVAVEPPLSVYVKESLPQKFAAGLYVRLAPPFVIVTVAPFGPFVLVETVFGPPSRSVSFASTSMVVAEASSSTVFESLTATGGSSTGVTVTSTVAGLELDVPSPAL